MLNTASSSCSTKHNELKDSFVFFMNNLANRDIHGVNIVPLSGDQTFAGGAIILDDGREFSYIAFNKKETLLGEFPDDFVGAREFLRASLSLDASSDIQIHEYDGAYSKEVTVDGIFYSFNQKEFFGDAFSYISIILYSGQHILIIDSDAQIASAQSETEEELVKEFLEFVLSLWD